MKAEEKFIKLRPQIQAMQKIAFGCGKVFVCIAQAIFRRPRPQFKIFPVLFPLPFFERSNQFDQCIQTVYKRLAMIGKRNGDQAEACNPASNPAQDYAVDELLAWRRGGVNDGLVTVSPAQCFEPTCAVEYGCVRAAFYKTLPARVLQRIELINAATDFCFLVESRLTKNSECQLGNTPMNSNIYETDSPAALAGRKR